jgi:hypothetical protein
MNVPTSIPAAAKPALKLLSAALWFFLCYMRVHDGRGPAQAPLAFYLFLATGLISLLAAFLDYLKFKKQRLNRAAL